MKKVFWTVLGLAAALFRAVRHAGMGNHNEMLVLDPASKYFRW